MNCSLGKTNETIKNLKELEYINDDNSLTDLGIDLIKKNKSAVILAAGQGIRMIPINNNVPKAMLEINDEILIERLIRQLIEAHINDITIVVGFMKEEFDFESIKNKAIEQLRAGKPLLGKDGAFAPLLESILNAALEGEMDAHLTEEERQMGNRRNGKMQKQVQTPLGEVTVSTPRDRNSSFDPQFIKKRETIPLLQEKKYTIQATYTTGIKENHTGQKCKNRYRQKPK